MDLAAKKPSPLLSECDPPDSLDPIRQLSDGMREAVWLTGLDSTKVISVNLAYESMWGRTCASLHEDSSSWLEGVHDEDRDRVRLACEMADESSFESEFQISRPDGTELWIRLRGFPMRDASGVVCRRAWIAEDTTARRQSEQEFDRFFNTSPDLMLISGFDGFVRRMNVPLRIPGCVSPEVVTSKPFLSFVHPDDRDLLTSEIGRLISDGTTRSFEIRSVMEDGSYNWFSWSATAFADRRVFYATGRDINAARVAQEALAERIRQQTCVAELGARALAEDDPGGLIADVPALVARTLGLDRASILELQRDGRDFLVRADFGWKTVVRNETRVSAVPETFCGYVLSTNVPVIIADLRGEPRFRDSFILRDEGIISGMGCLIPGPNGPYGILSVFSTNLRTFTEDDVHFLLAVAHIVAGAIERRRAHDELDQFFTPSLNPMYIGGFDGQIKRCNRALEVLSGYSQEELQAIPMLSFVHPDEQGITAAAIQSLADGGATESREFRVRCRDGSYKWTVWNSTPGLDLGVFYSIGFDVSDRHAIQEARAAREEEIHTLLDSLSEGVCRMDLEGVCTFTNAASLQLLGYDSPDEVLGKSIHTLVHHSYADGRPMAPEDCRIRRAFVEDRQEHVWDEVFWRRDGTSFPAEYWSYPIHHSGIIVSYVVSFLDITERVEAAAERDRFYNHTLTPMCVLGFDGAFKSANRTVESTFGYSWEELKSLPYEMLVVSEDREILASTVRSLAAGKESVDFEIRHLCKDGSFKWMSWSAIPYVDKETFYCVGHDVTKRHESEEALRVSQETLTGIGKSAFDGIVVMDSEGLVAYWNPGAERIFGYTSDEIMGRVLHDILVPKEPRDRHRTAFPRFLQTGQGTLIGKVVELEALHKDGRSIPVEVTVGAISLHGKWNAVGIIRDITDRLAAESQIRSDQEFLHSTVNALSAHIAILDENGTILEVNRAWQCFGEANRVVAARAGAGLPHYELMAM